MSGVDLPLRCACGAVRGVLHDVSPGTVNRVICYCDDCQAFLRALGRADLLDAHGRTDIGQTSPANVEITVGRERLAALRLTPGGLVRWYTTCCLTPVGNTMARPIPAFVGVISSFVDHSAHPRDAVMGRGMGIQARFATGAREGLDAHDRAPAGVLLRSIAMLIRWNLRSDRRVSPFFDRSGSPMASPRVLTSAELAAARGAP